MVNLPQQTFSIVDELKSRGFKPEAGETLPYFNLRQNLYEQSGLKPLLGEFKGSGEQNTQLLRQIREKNLTPQAIGAPAVQPFGPVAPQTITPQQPATTAGGALATIGATPQPARMPTANELGVPERLTAQQVMAQIGQVPSTTPEQVLSTAQGGLTAQIAQRQGQEAIAAGEAGAQQVAEQFGSRGLFFSGARVSAEGAKRATALSKKMSIDEGLAKFIIQQQEQGDKETASRIMDKVKDLVDENKTTRKEALDFWNSMGYGVSPSGQLFQKPSEIRAEETAQRAEEASQRAEEANIRAEARLTLQEERAKIADERALRAEQRAVDSASRAEAAELRSEARFEKFVADQEKANKKFISPDFFKTAFGTDALYDQAKEAGQDAGWFASAKDKAEVVNKYTESLMTTVKQYQDAGFTDSDILKLMK